jgi:dTDP-4-dehydrorhamnose reductase
LLGSVGQVGYQLQQTLKPLGKVTALTHECNGKLCGDLTQLCALAATVRQLRPDVIVNAAAYTHVDRAEFETEQAASINTTALGVLAAEAKSLSALLVHYSTDYVFDGSGDRPWREQDRTEPLNTYGRTKLDGERIIQDSGCRHLIFRTSWVYSARRKNFIHTVLRLAVERETLQMIDDQYGAPTEAKLIADTTAFAIRHCWSQQQDDGLYHLAARGEATWFTYAQHIIKVAREVGWPVRVADSAIQPISSDDYQTAAQRPQNSRLNITRLESTFGIHMPHWRIGVDRVLNEICAAEQLSKDT